MRLTGPCSGAGSHYPWDNGTRLLHLHRRQNCGTGSKTPMLHLSPKVHGFLPLSGAGDRSGTSELVAAEAAREAAEQCMGSDGRDALVVCNCNRVTCLWSRACRVEPSLPSPVLSRRPEHWRGRGLGARNARLHWIAGPRCTAI